MTTRAAEQLYTFADLSRLLKVPPSRLRALRSDGALLGPDVIVPGGGRKAQRWSASRVAGIQREWSASSAAFRRPDFSAA